MKLPRWLLIGIIAFSAVGILSVPVCWWIEWPRATARRFMTFIANGRFDDATAMMRGEGEWSVFMYDAHKDTPEVRPRKYADEQINFERRSAIDILKGRVVFWVKDSYWINAERSMVYDEVEAFFWSGGGAMIR